VNLQAVTFDVDADGIAVATMDLPGRPMNVVGDALMAGLAQALEGLARPEVKGLILASGKADFCAGGDLDHMAAWTRPEQAFDAAQAMKAVLRRLETQGKPVAAAIHGHALGGGLEIALACHARFALDDPRIRLGQPEVRLGLLPGGGGTVRLPRLLGQQQALRIMLEGKDLSPQQCMAIGLLAGLASDREALMALARRWITAHPLARQPWDAPDFRMPGGDSRSAAALPMWSVAPAVAAARTWGNYPAVLHIMSSVFEGGLLDFEAASQVESRFFAACATSLACRNLIGALWTQLNAVKKGASRPAGQPRGKVARLGVLGAGMMGAGIAHAAAEAGIEVVLIDTTQARADEARRRVQGLLDQAVSKGRIGAEERDAALARIAPGTDFGRLAGADLVIEAVPEDRALKAEVTRQAEAVLDANAFFASNTSTLPISGLARASLRPAGFIGLHFFSPVHRMPLVEIVVGDETSARTLARGFDFVRQIGKTPIVVNDRRGFYTSRVFGTYLLEGLAMLLEGVHPRHIEVAGLQAGMPMPPLALQDEVSLSLSLQVAEQTAKDLAAEGREGVDHPGMAAVRRMCALGRTGRKAGKGFYDWEPPAKHLWPGLAEFFPVSAAQPPQRELIDRLLIVQANEAARCLEEGVLRSVADGNVGSILGWGFAPFHGGALRYIDAMGPSTFVARARALAAAHGARFEPADIVCRAARHGRPLDLGQ
jgi:3-hydroxyacyl-CoA dehydrogenase/enoyl-CoA hydratase/3-hydroxybutyryl-CoA epimerase